MRSGSLMMGVLLQFCSVGFGQWEPDRRLTFNDSVSATSRMNNAWCIAASGETVHAVWYDKRDGNFEIYYKRSLDCGQTWSADTRLTVDVRGSDRPALAVDGQWVYVVWDDGRGGLDLYCKRSSDAGATWGPDVRLTTSAGGEEDPSVAASGSGVFVGWYEYRNGKFDPFIKRSSDHGETWEADVCLFDDTAWSGAPTISASGQFVHAVWPDGVYENSDLLYGRSTDAGVSWCPLVALTRDMDWQDQPSVAACDPCVHLVWSDARYSQNVEVFYRRSTDNGQTWEQDLCLSSDTSWSEFPTICVSGNNVHVVWQSRRGAGNYELRYRCSRGRGLNWLSPQVLTGECYDQRASVTAGGPGVHVLWPDDRDQPDSARPEVYYKRDPTGNVGLQEASPSRALGPDVRPTVLSALSVRLLASGVVFDAMGRRCAAAKSGVYFLREGLGTRGQGLGRARKVVIQR